MANNTRWTKNHIRARLFALVKSGIIPKTVDIPKRTWDDKTIAAARGLNIELPSPQTVTKYFGSLTYILQEISEELGIPVDKSPKPTREELLESLTEFYGTYGFWPFTVAGGCWSPETDNMEHRLYPPHCFTSEFGSLDRAIRLTPQELDRLYTNRGDILAEEDAEALKRHQWDKEWAEDLKAENDLDRASQEASDYELPSQGSMCQSTFSHYPLDTLVYFEVVDKPGTFSVGKVMGVQFVMGPDQVSYTTYDIIGSYLSTSVQDELVYLPEEFVAKMRQEQIR